MFIAFTSSCPVIFSFPLYFFYWISFLIRLPSHLCIPFFSFIPLESTCFLLSLFSRFSLIPFPFLLHINRFPSLHYHLCTPIFFFISLHSFYSPFPRYHHRHFPLFLLFFLCLHHSLPLLNYHHRISLLYRSFQHLNLAILRFPPFFIGFTVYSILIPFVIISFAFPFVITVHSIFPLLLFTFITSAPVWSLRHVPLSVYFHLLIILSVSSHFLILFCFDHFFFICSLRHTFLTKVP